MDTQTIWMEIIKEMNDVYLREGRNVIHLADNCEAQAIDCSTFENVVRGFFPPRHQ